TIGLLYESQGSAITYKNITREELAPNLRFDGEEGGEEEEVDTSLVAFFEFDGDVSNSIGETPAGERVGSGVTVSNEGGINGGALHFTKEANSYFKIPDMINTATSDFTLSSWVKYESGYSDGTNKISLFQQNETNGRTLVFLTPSNNYGTFITQENSNSNQSVNVTKYHLVTMTWDASEKTIKIYVNGESYHSATFTRNPSDILTDLYVGGHKDGSVGGAIKGYVDELRIYNRILEANEIKELFDVYKDSELLKDPPPPPDLPLKLTVNPESEVRTFPEGMFGINHRYHNNGYGTWNTQEKKIEDEFNEYVKEAGFGSVRYPGGTVSNLFEWKRSIGPVEERKATVNGSTFFDGVGQAPVEPNFGVDEAMTWIRDDLKANAIYVYGMKGSASDAADLIEYLNAPADGDVTNPNGGTDWAEIRKENGHEAPYNVTTFEIGNEVGQWGQTYWLEGATGRNHVEAFINGGVMTFANSTKTVQEEDWRTAAANSNGTANQVRYTYSSPLVEGSVSVFVGDTQFTVVDSLEGQGAQNVCTVDYATGKITFGDGTNGNIPQSGQQIKAGYQTTQDGFLATARAMKNTAEQIGIEINVLAGVEDKTGFVNKMKELNANDVYDGIAIHPYSNNPIGANDAEFYEKMLGRTLENNVTRVQNLMTSMKNATGQDKMVGVSEFGIYKYTHSFVKALGHAIYIANEMIYYTEMGADYLNKHCLVDFVSGDGTGADSLGPVGQCVIQAVLQSDGSYRFVSTPSAKMFSIFNNMAGNILIEETVSGNETFYTYNGSYNVPQANFLSTKDEQGNVYVIAVNNEKKANDFTLALTNTDLQGKEIDVWYMTADSVLAENTLANPDLVDVVKETMTVSGQDIQYTLTPNSVTGFKISLGSQGEEPGGGSGEEP
ncbi:MAG: hypothetical protein IKW28_01170, partial [Lachnospiraceae bacterium]|nr:hypothetical protein [Lachnospiraceae bacterium]